MKKNYFIAILLLNLALLSNSCTKTKCAETGAINYNQSGECIAASNTVVGQFTGSYLMAVGNSNILGYATAQVTKVNDTLVTVTLTGTTPVSINEVFNATVNYTDTGYHLTVDSMNGIAGAAAHYNSPADGIFTPSINQLILYIKFNSSGVAYLSYTGVEQ